MKTSIKINAVLTFALIVCASLQTFAQEVDSMLLMYKEQQRQLQEMMNPPAPAPSAESERLRARNESAQGSMFNVLPFVNFAWYPYSEFLDDDNISTRSNMSYGTTYQMGFKFFEKYGAYLNVELDDPFVGNLKSIAGAIDANLFVLRFDYRTIGGTVTWADDEVRNPIRNNSHSFEKTFINGAVIYKWFFDDEAKEDRTWVGVGAFYNNATLPLALNATASDLESGRLTNPGFGDVVMNTWGIGIVFDSWNWTVESNDPFWTHSFGDHLGGWFNFDGWFGIGTATASDEALQSLVDNNDNINSVDDLPSGYSSGDFGGASFLKISTIAGVVRTWEFGTRGLVALGIGAEARVEFLGASDLGDGSSTGILSIGPTVRLGARF